MAAATIVTIAMVIMLFARTPGRQGRRTSSAVAPPAGECQTDRDEG